MYDDYEYDDRWEEFHRLQADLAERDRIIAQLETDLRNAAALQERLAEDSRKAWKERDYYYGLWRETFKGASDLLKAFDGTITMGELKDLPKYVRDTAWRLHVKP